VDLNCNDKRVGKGISEASRAPWQCINLALFPVFPGKIKQGVPSTQKKKLALKISFEL